MVTTIPQNDDPRCLVVDRDYYHARAFVRSNGRVDAKHSIGTGIRDVYADFDTGFRNGVAYPDTTFVIFTIDCTPPEARKQWGGRGGYPGMWRTTMELAKEILELEEDDDNGGEQ